MPSIKIKNKETGKWEELPTVRGKSAYEIWLEQGNTGTEQAFLDSLNGTDGVDGFSPTTTVTQTETGATITITDKNGTTTTNIANGKDGSNGEDGYTPVKGTDYWTEEDKAEIVQMVIESLGGNPVYGYVDENNNIIVSGNLPDGNYIVKYEMEDGSSVTIGNLELDNTVDYSIKNNLTNCTNSNKAISIVEGESYSATITANNGYELKSVTVTMGGSTVSVNGGNINIASVIGDIVITAEAEEKVVTPDYTNVLPLSIDANGNDYKGTNGEDGYKTGVKISTTSGSESSASACASGFIPLAIGEHSQVRIKNITVSSSSSINNIVFYNEDKTKRNGYSGTAGAFSTNVSVKDGVYTFTTSSWFTMDNLPSFLRFSCDLITDETIVTINEEIV